MIKNIRLFPNLRDESKQIAEMLMQKLMKNGFTICEEGYDLGIAIGGDGSFLHMLKDNNFNTLASYIGVNAGTLGFLQEIRPDNIDKFIDNLGNEEYRTDMIGIQETTIDYQEGHEKFYSLNEIAIERDNRKLFTTKVLVDDEYLETFNGDGLIIATSVGSTAHNLSYGGSIIHSNLHTLQITPKGGLNNKAFGSLLNSIILPEDKIITLIPREDNRDIMISIDGVDKVYQGANKVETTVSDKKIKCLRMNNYNFINVVNEKFLGK